MSTAIIGLPDMRTVQQSVYEKTLDVGYLSQSIAEIPLVIEDTILSE